MPLARNDIDDDLALALGQCMALAEMGAEGPITFASFGFST
jgi:hypothetical protein